MLRSIDYLNWLKDQQIKVRSTDKNQDKQKLKNRSEAYDKLTDEQID